MKKRKYNLILISIIFLIIIIINIVIVFQGIYYRALNEALRTTRYRAYEISRSINSIVTSNDFFSISDISDMKTDTYKNLQKVLNVVRVSSNVKYLFTVKKNAEGKYVYLVDGMALESDDFRYPGDYIEKEFINDVDMAYQGQNVISDRIIFTEWGEVITAFYPVYDSVHPNMVYGILGITFDMNATIQKLNSILVIGITSVIIVLIIGIILLVLLLKEKKNLEVVAQLEKEAKKKDDILKFERRQYKEAIIHSCNRALAFDVTKGILTEENILKTYEDKENPTVKFPIAFDEYMKIGAEASKPVINKGNMISRSSLLKEFAEGKTLLESEYYVEKSGKYYKSTALLMKNEIDGHIYASIFNYDVTEEKQREYEVKRKLEVALEEAKRANEAKTEFLSKMSHDIRTPLNAIVGMTELAIFHSGEEEKVKDFLKKIRISGEHLLALINEVLDMRRIESGAVKLNVEELRIEELIENIVSITKGDINAHQHQLSVSIEGIKHFCVFADKLQMQQILLNLLGNSIKYTPNGGKLRIEVKETKEKEQDYSDYEFLIEDDGIGMTKEYLENIYEPFSREEDNRTSKIVGTGLGMSIVKKLVENMGGQIDITSEPEKGTTFRIRFTFKHTAEKHSDEKKKSDQKEENNTVNYDKRILLVDDQEFNREIAREFIEMTGAAVEEATNGKEAIDKITSSKEFYYDMIFMDIQMPVMDGYQATRAIRKLPREDVQKIPIIALTANAFTEDVQNALDAGMNAHMAKPIEFHKIKSIMKKWL